MISSRITLPLRQSRTELLLLAAIVSAISLAMFMTAGSLDSLHLGSCFGSSPDSACGPRFAAADNLMGTVQYLLLAGAGAPILAGAILGVAVVGRELDQGTATLAWSFARSRRRWLVSRWFVLGLALVVISALPAAAGSHLVGSADPSVDPGSSLVNYALRGWLVPARAIMVYGIATVAGLVVGRVLPALLVGLIAVWLALVLAGWGLDRWLAGQVTALELRTSGDLVSSILYRDPSGALVTYEVAIQQLEGSGEIPDGNYPIVRMGVPGGRHDGVEAAGSALVLAIGAIALAAAVIGVEQRRPS